MAPQAFEIAQNGLAKLKDGVGPGALRRNGALFRCARNVWEILR
jgi:hypothetical protein